MNRPYGVMGGGFRADDIRPYKGYRRDRRPRRSVVAVSIGDEPLSHGVAVTAPLEGSLAGSDGSAAGGGRSDLSEWQRSTIEEGVSRRREGRAPQQDDIRPYEGAGGGFAERINPLPTIHTGGVVIYYCTIFVEECKEYVLALWGQ